MNSNNKGLAHVMIIGGMKCGTTSFYDYLIKHPQICPCKVKEPEFFSSKMTHGISGIKQYEDLWSGDPEVHKVLLEASTGYTRYPLEQNIPQKISQYGLKPKFIYVVRNPYKRIVSHQNFMKRYAGYNKAATEDEVMLTSNYYLQLKQFLEYFSKESFLLLEFEDLLKEPEQAAQKVVDFLQLDSFKFPAEMPKENTTIVPSESEMKIKESGVFQQIRKYIPEPIAIKGKQFLKNFSKEMPYILSEEEKEFIHNKLHGDMIKFQETWGIAVEKWGFK